MTTTRPTERTYTSFHLCCGIGGGGLGFQGARASFHGYQGSFRTLGGVDNDPKAIEDWDRLVGVPGTVLDLFTAEDYVDFHSTWRRDGEGVAARWVCEKRVEPPAGWREATPADILASAGGEHPDVVFTSSPCKGLSGLLSNEKSASPRYQALNRLVVRSIFLTLEAFAARPPRLIILENVPRIVQRGRALLDQVEAMLRAYGYAVAEGAHNCGEIGGLGQNRQRFLMVARHVETTQPYLYEPPRHRVRSIGEILEQLPMPDDERGGPMHRLPRLKRETVERLALIPAGKDWKALRDVDVSKLRLEPVGGAKFNNCFRVVRWSEPSPAVTGGAGPSSGGLAVQDPRVYQDAFGNICRVTGWDEPAGTVTGASRPSGGAASVADPRIPKLGAEDGHAKMRVEDWNEPAHTVTGSDRVGSGALSIADPRLAGEYGPKSVTLRVKPWDEPAPTVSGSSDVWDSGGFAVGDPRPTGPRGGKGKYQIPAWDEPSPTVIAASTTGQGAFAVADPRLPPPGTWKNGTLGVQRPDAPAGAVCGESYPFNGAFSIADARLGIEPRNGTLKVADWERPGDTVTGAGDIWAGSSAVADPRPWPPEDLLVIIALDGTWHRPLTTLELAALQSLPLRMADGSPLKLAGKSSSRWREAVGNLVPPLAAQAIAEAMLRTLLAHDAGFTFMLDPGDVWVRPEDEHLMCAPQAVAP